MIYLKTGDEAPPFEGVDQHGNPVKLTDFKGETLILFFHKSEIKRSYCSETPGTGRKINHDYSLSIIKIYGQRE